MGTAAESTGMRMLARSALLGVATGMRSMAAPSQLSRHLRGCGRQRGEGPIRGALRRPGVSAALQVAAAGEMVVDKLPIVPARVTRGPLFARLVIGTMAGAVGAELNDRSRAVGALIGGAGALLGALLGYHARRALTRSAGLPDLPVALAEDALAIHLARMGVSDSRRT